VNVGRDATQEFAQRTQVRVRALASN
jgi:hypothetical protein